MRTFRIGEKAATCIALGSSYFGTTWEESRCFDLMDRYIELGGTCLDTARVYGAWFDHQFGAAEKTIGKYLDSRRLKDKIAVVTKGAHPMPETMHVGRLSRTEIIDDISRSLEALRSDKVDLYLLHRDDMSRDVGDIIETMNELLSRGYTDSVGCSNWTHKRIREANAYAVSHGLRPFEVSQIQWSLADTSPEMYGDDTLVCMTDEEYDFYKTEKFPLMAYASQAKGFFAKGARGGIEALNAKAMARFGTEKNIERLEKVKKLSEEKNESPAAISLQYITDSELKPIAIIGCSSVSQLEDTMSKATLSREELDWLK